MYWFVIYICTDGISLTKLQINWSRFPFHFSLTHGYVLACLSWCETVDLSWLYLFAVLPWDWGHTFVDWPTIFWLLWKWLVLILLVVGLLPWWIWVGESYLLYMSPLWTFFGCNSSFFVRYRGKGSHRKRIRNPDWFCAGEIFTVILNIYLCSTSAVLILIS